MKRIIYIFTAFLLIVSLAACSKAKDNSPINTITPTTGVEPTMDEAAPNGTAKVPADDEKVTGPASDPVAQDTGDTDKTDADISAESDEDTGIDQSQQNSQDSLEEGRPSGTNEGDPHDQAHNGSDNETENGSDPGKQDTDKKDETPGAVTSSPDNDRVNDSDADKIREYWSNSFLVWLPVFEKASYLDTAHDETHDYIMLGDISASDIEHYISDLTGAGFNTGAGYIDHPDFRFGGSLEYSASNSEGWEAFIDYDDATCIAIIGSGYSEPPSDGYRELMQNTLLGKLPEFTYGTFDSGMNDGSTQYAIFYDADSDCSVYIDELKDAGFILDADEGNESGIIWYNAERPDGLVCEFIYTGGMVRIGCRND